MDSTIPVTVVSWLLYLFIEVNFRHNKRKLSFCKFNIRQVTNHCEKCAKIKFCAVTRVRLEKPETKFLDINLTYFAPCCSQSFLQADFTKTYLLYFGFKKSFQKHREISNLFFFDLISNLLTVLRIRIRIRIYRIHMFLGLLDPDPSMIKQK